MGTAWALRLQVLFNEVPGADAAAAAKAESSSWLRVGEAVEVRRVG